jgi:hypothetical protein
MERPRTGALSALIALSTIWGTGCKDPEEEVSETSGASEEGTASEGGTADASSGEPACTDQDDQVLFASEGVLVSPMELENAGALGIEVVGSRTPEMGTLTLEFTTTCDGPLHLFAMVWDANGGVDPDNADSVYVQIDDDEEQAWLYGCDTDGPDQLWHWLPMKAWTMTQCDHDPFMVESLPAGVHTITFRGREGGVGGLDIAALAAVVVSHVEDTDPSPFFPIPEPEE